MRTPAACPSLLSIANWSSGKSIMLKKSPPSVAAMIGRRSAVRMIAKIASAAHSLAICARSPARSNREKTRMNIAPPEAVRLNA